MRLSEPRDPNSDAATLRERLSSLNEAVLAVGGSLDLNAVLHEAADGARALTGARYGVVATLDEAGLPQEFVTSGLTEAMARRLTARQPDGLRLFAHLRDLPGPLRLPDLPGYVRSLGFAGDMVLGTTFLSVPLRGRDGQLGCFFLADKDGGEEFGEACEEIVGLFASQAANAIANARAHGAEHRARADLEALIETSPVGVAVFGPPDGEQVRINREAMRLIADLGEPGMSQAELLRAVVARREDGREVTREDLLSGETLHGEEVEVSGPSGLSRRVMAYATPVRSATGETVSAVAVLQDLAPVERLRRLRVEFLRMVSHELRVPLTSIKGSAASARHATHTLDEAEARQFFRIIDEQADRMGDLIGNLLDAGRIGTGTLPVEPTPTALAGLVDEARTNFRRSEARGRLIVDLAPDLPAVMADGRRIVQVLNNLLSNARRHAGESAPVRIAAERDGAQVAVTVADEGKGIPPERLAGLFSERAGRDALDRASGGLGLFICQGLVEAHGGRIRAESGGIGRGARFTFTLPAAENGDALRGGSPAPAERRDRTRILVLDDDPETLRYLRQTLSEAGYEPLATGDPKEVAAIVRKKRPQLAVLDLMLPGTDGIELMERVPELGDLPVIFLSGYERDETIARALDAGAVDYIVKPCSATELVARVRAALRRQAGAEPFVLGDLAIDYERRAVTVAGRAVRLTPTEYRLLCALSTNAGRVMPYASLRRRVWANGGDGDSEPVRSFVKSLRRKLGEDPARPAYIHNERGVGYCMRAADEG